MFSKQELDLAKKIIPNEKFLKSNAGLKAVLQGLQDAAKQAARY